MEVTGFIDRDMEDDTDNDESSMPDSLMEKDLESVDMLVSFVSEQFNKAEKKKLDDEARFLDAYRNYRGLYSPDTQFTDAEKSRVFVKVTKTKVQAAYGQIIQVLSGNGKFPLTVDQTTLPEGAADTVHMNTDPAVQSNPEANAALESPFGTVDKKLPPGATVHNLGKLPPKLEKIGDKLVAGPGTTPGTVTFHPAHIAAKKMEKKIHDQLEESSAVKHLRSSAFEMALFGTGVIKGPFRETKEYPNWDEEGNYTPVIKDIPTIKHVSVWNFYPDPDANNMEECQFAIERHKKSEVGLLELKKNPSFDGKAIDEAIDIGPNYQRKGWESSMEDGSSHAHIDRYEVLEYWGYASRELAEEKGIKIPKHLSKVDNLQLNVWICNDRVIRVVLNPFKPANIPYHASPYELNPYSFFGIGVGENMEDTQLLMNGFMRMAVDNAALSGNLVFEIQDSTLVGDQDLQIYPGKTFVTENTGIGQTIFAHKFPNVTGENLQLFDKARLLADESTGIPSYSHGQTGVQGVGRTASGISMLMDASSITTKTVVKNLDDYLILPLGKGLFSYNMQFDPDPEIKGDLEVKARGTEGLMAKEIKSQRLMTFLQVMANPILAPFANFGNISRGIAEALELDPDQVINSAADAAIQADMLSKMQPQGGGAGGPQQPSQGVPGASTDPTGAGGGNIGTGQAPGPGMEAFSGNGGGEGV